METRNNKPQIGIGGWEHDILDQTFYPDAEMTPEEKLNFYSRFFSTVEVRSTFWDDSLTPDEASSWMDGVSENTDFRFSVKLHSSFTHRKISAPPSSKNIRAVLAEFAKNERLSRVLVQFPYSFSNTSSNRFYLTKLGEMLDGFPAFVEFRHESWNIDSLTDVLSERKFFVVNADLPRAKHLMRFTTEIVGKQAYIRLHGRNERGWLLNGMDTRYDYLYNGRELRELKRRIDLLTKRCSDITVVFNNTTGAKGLANAFQLLHSTQDQKLISIPEKTLSAFPFLRELSVNNFSSQPLLDEEWVRQAI